MKKHVVTVGWTLPLFVGGMMAMAQRGNTLGLLAGWAFLGLGAALAIVTAVQERISL